MNLQDKTTNNMTSYLMLTGVMMLWSLGIIVAKGVYESVNPIGFSFLRWVVAALLLTPVLVPQLRSQWRFMQSRLWHLLLLGLFMAGGSTMLMLAVQHTTATNAALFSASQPIVTVFMAWVFLRDKPSRIQILGMLAALGGIFAMATRLDLEVLQSLTFNPGDLLVLLAVLFYSLYSINLHRWLSGVRPFLMMLVTIYAGILILLPFYTWELLVVGQFEMTPEVLWAIFFMAVIPTIVATTMWNISVGRVGAKQASIFLNLLPLFGIGLAVSFLGETLHHYHVVGALLICTGITAVVWPSSE